MKLTVRSVRSFVAALQARRQISQSLQEGKSKLQEQQPTEALALFKRVCCRTMLCVMSGNLTFLQGDVSNHAISS